MEIGSDPSPVSREGGGQAVLYVFCTGKPSNQVDYFYSYILALLALLDLALSNLQAVLSIRGSTGGG